MAFLPQRITGEICLVITKTGLEEIEKFRGLIQAEPVLAYAFDADRYDCGSKLGYLKAQVAFGVRHRTVGSAFTDHLVSLYGPREPVAHALASESATVNGSGTKPYVPFA